MKRVGVLVTLLASFVFASVANAATVNVNCNKHGKIGPVLNILNPQGPNTINVTGTCKENLNIYHQERGQWPRQPVRVALA